MWVMMTVLDRLDMTKRSLGALVQCNHHYKIIVIDNGSNMKTLAFLRTLLASKQIDTLIENHQPPQWQKCWAIKQAYDLLQKLEYEFFAWVDNDVVVTPEWSTVGRRVLESAGVHAACFCVDRRQIRFHGEGFPAKYKDIQFTRRQSANGALWVVRKDFFQKFGLPPIGKGINREGTEDWYYTDKLTRMGCKLPFACFDKYAEHIGVRESQKGKVLRSGK